MKDSIFTVPTLPTELIAEILSRVPVKSLLQFRCVSKSWLALICSPEFVKTHLSVSAKNKDHTHHRILLTELGKLCCSLEAQCVLRDCSIISLGNDSMIEALDLDYPMNNPRQSVSVVGSVNGLICLVIKDNDLVLWNPSIRKFKKLPDSGLKIEASIGCHFDSHTSVMYGFGYDESTDDYKVVGVLCYDRYNILHHVEVKIYSLKSDSWRGKNDIPGWVKLIKPCKFANGKLHWFNNINGGFHKDGNIISIDLADEKWGKVEQPFYGEGDFFWKLEVLRGDLSMFCYYMTSQLDVWVMREYGVKESWTKTYTIKYPGHVFSPFISRTLCLSNKGEILLVPGSILMAHNPEEEPIRYPKITDFGFCVAVNIYIESLVCPLLRNKQITEQE